MAEAQERPVRLIVDADGRTWHVYVVIEGFKWDPEIEERRRNWLCLETDRDRRFISPVPDDWQRWSEDRLLREIRSARPDLRGQQCFYGTARDGR